MDDKLIREILEKEIERHTNEIKEHKRLAEIRNSKSQKQKETKHFHKRFQTIKLANLFGFELCECCGRLK